jgi:lipoprotein-anchoring transpeptidase ErfK/SrfK
MTPDRHHRLRPWGAVALAAALATVLGAAPDRGARADAPGGPPAASHPAPSAATRPGIELAPTRGSWSPAATEPASSRVERFLLVAVERALPVTRRPGGGRAVGWMPGGSRFYGTSTVAWVRRVSSDGRYGLVDVPYAAEPAAGWIRLRGLERSWTRVSVVADLSAHHIVVRRGGRVLFRAPAATGAPASPTPTGRYAVTDRVAFPGGGVLGTFAFGISGIQPNLPAGWTGGDQLAIHGTNAPSTIGRSASAGCLRVSERILDRLRPLLRLGTPVIVRA